MIYSVVHRFALTALTVLPLLGGTACNGHTADEPDLTIDDTDNITFTDPSVRNPTTTQTISRFKVWAVNGNHILMDGTIVTRQGINTWTYSPTVKWPEEGSVDFYAVSPEDIPQEGFHPLYYRNIHFKSDGATDLLVSVRMGARQTSGRLRLNFCHTLARVTVSLSSSLSDTIVQLKRVSLLDIANDGNFHIPQKTTMQDVHDDDITDAWTVYNMNSTSCDVFYTEDYALLTDSPLTPSGKAEFFIPVKFSPLVMEGYLHGSAIEIAYRLYDRKTGKKLWPDDNTHNQLIPEGLPEWGAAYFSLLDNTPGGRWKAGREYHYDIKITGPASLPGSRAKSMPGITIKEKDR